MDYLQWQSKLTLEQVFAQGESFNYPTSLGDGYLYLSQQKEKGNRSVLMFNQSSDTDDPSACITPVPYNLRTKINEYGGKPYWVFGNKLYFANQADQRIYQQMLDFETGVATSPIAVTTQTTDHRCFMYADLVALDDHWMLAVIETSDDDISENVHSIQAFNNNSPDVEAVQLVSGASFYSNLVISSDKSKVAWIQWNHPEMPWDETQLWVADICCESGQPTLINMHRIHLANKTSAESNSICQLIFANNGYLFFSADYRAADPESSENYWNIMCYKFDGVSAHPVTSLALEFGYPHWQYGDARIVQIDDEHLLAFGTGVDGDELYLINQETLTNETMLATSFMQKHLQNLSANSTGKAMAVMLSADSNPSLVEFQFAREEQINKPKIVLSNLIGLNKDDISVAQHFEFTTRDKVSAYGYYYPPVNAAYKNDVAPPLIVMVHGGPTARAYGYFDIQKQFWTNRGFAVFDVNPRGSSGYGRAYRDALYGQWGVSDISDIVDGINHLIELDKADQNKVCIRGKSSGGYAVLRALTDYPETFQVGACYYGIGNLVTLAEVTHKFEKYYTDQLIGETYDVKSALQKNSLFYQRSPINKLADLKTPMILFQGLEDKIVPPSVAQEVVSVLEQTGLKYDYIEYPDEGHGFRQVANNIDALSREIAFYQTVLSS